MKTRCRYKEAYRDLEGNLTISFMIPDDDSVLNALNMLKEKDLVLEAKKYSPKRSLSANGMFWALCDDIAKVLGTSQQEAHDLMLYRYGVSSILIVNKDIMNVLDKHFDIVEPLREFNEVENCEIVEKVECHCWVGSRYYSVDEMRRLLDGTVYEAKGLGISVVDKNEIERLVEAWQA